MGALCRLESMLGVLPADPFAVELQPSTRVFAYVQMQIEALVTSSMSYSEDNELHLYIKQFIRHLLIIILSHLFFGDFVDLRENWDHTGSYEAYLNRFHALQEENYQNYQNRINSVQNRDTMVKFVQEQLTLFLTAGQNPANVPPPPQNQRFHAYIVGQLIKSVLWDSFQVHYDYVTDFFPDIESAIIQFAQNEGQLLPSLISSCASDLATPGCMTHVYVTLRNSNFTIYNARGNPLPSSQVLWNCLVTHHLQAAIDEAERPVPARASGASSSGYRRQ